MRNVIEIVALTAVLMLVGCSKGSNGYSDASTPGNTVNPGATTPAATLSPSTAP